MVPSAATTTQAELRGSRIEAKVVFRTPGLSTPATKATSRHALMSATRATPDATHRRVEMMRVRPCLQSSSTGRTVRIPPAGLNGEDRNIGVTARDQPAKSDGA